MLPAWWPSDKPFLVGDVIGKLALLPNQSVQCGVTSPPYWGLRDYQVEGQLGLEPTPEEYVANMVEVFRAFWRVLRDDGTLWLNLGDSYAGNREKATESATATCGNTKEDCCAKFNKVVSGLKPKDLVGIPWRVAFALQSDGWYLRSDIIWHKPNPMPESCTDRPTKSHEYIFLLTKNDVYYFDNEAIKEKQAEETLSDKRENGHENRGGKFNLALECGVQGSKFYRPTGGMRNRRSVWRITTKPYGNAMDYTNADYVGKDGKPYKVSPSCPIHSHVLTNQTTDTLECGEQLNPVQNHNPGTYPHHAKEPLSEQSATNPRDNHDARLSKKDCLNPNISQKQTLESTTVNKIQSNQTEHTLGVENHDHTMNTELYGDTQTGMTDYSLPSNVQIATLHNNQNRKKGRVPSTNLPCISSGENPSCTQRIGEEPEKIDLGVHTGESNTSADSSLSAFGLSVQTPYHNADKSKTCKPVCTCTICTFSHFAVFPPEIPEICIKAGTSEKGACPKCGSPWERVMETKRENSISRQDRQTATGGAITGGVGKNFPETTSKTIGWQPTCSCGIKETTPCIVLDPFAGSGTTIVVAEQLGRIGLGIDLNPSIAKHYRNRLAGGDVGNVGDIFTFDEKGAPEAPE
jgi:DNA modification methylase